MLRDNEAARFVGLYVSFPINQGIRRDGILTELLGLEQTLAFNVMKYGTLGKVREAPFEDETLAKALKSIETGEMDWLQLYSKDPDHDWIRSYENRVHLGWSSFVRGPLKRPSSPIEERFGSAGSVTAIYPRARFEVDSESTFQRSLLRVVKRLWVEQDIHWAFANEGLRPKRPFSVGEDDIFAQTREKFFFVSVEFFFSSLPSFVE
jgi:hypothetical protein